MSDSRDPRNFLIRREGDTGVETHGYTNRETYMLWCYMLDDLDGVLMDQLCVRNERTIEEIAPAVKQFYQDAAMVALSGLFYDLVLLALSDVDWEQIAGKLLEYL
jgi:hypothetical protein